MALRWGRDRQGRVYWYDSVSGRRVTAPADSQRPRVYRVDSLGRGYWTWTDTGGRAPKPAWDAAPSYDRQGRPRDSAGKRVPASALEAESVLSALPATPKKPRAKPKKPAGKPKKRKKPAGKPKKPPTKPKPKPTKKKRPKKLPPPPPAAPTRRKAAKPVRHRKPRRARHQIRGAGQDIPGFATPRGVYTTREAEHELRGLGNIFGTWAKGAARKSGFMSVDEIGFRQFGVMFKVEAPLDHTALAELTHLLVGQPVRVVYRALGFDRWEIWMHMNRPERRTGEIAQKTFDQVRKSFDKAQTAGNIIYDYLAEWDADFSWYEYIETDDDLYEG